MAWPTRNQKDDLADDFGGKCYWGGSELPPDPGSWDADHYEPVARGGEDELDNIVPSCPDHNQLKYDSDPDDFADDLDDDPDLQPCGGYRPR